MTGRTVAFVEWALAAVLVLCLVGFLVLSQFMYNLTLGVTITSLFFAPGLALSLATNGALHFFRRGRLAVSEYVVLGIEGVVIALLLVASVVDQVNYGPTSGISSGFGHWLDWFMPLWVVIGPIALTVLIMAIVKRTPRASATVPATAPASRPVAEQQP